jgi:hypothetical protein
MNKIIPNLKTTVKDATFDERRSYRRGAFMQVDKDKLMADYPPLLSESSLSAR